MGWGGAHIGHWGEGGSSWCSRRQRGEGVVVCGGGGGASCSVCQCQCGFACGVGGEVCVCAWWQRTAEGQRHHPAEQSMAWHGGTAGELRGLR